MKVKWTPLARKHLRHTANYIQTNEGSRSYETFADECVFLPWRHLTYYCPVGLVHFACGKHLVQAG